MIGQSSFFRIYRLISLRIPGVMFGGDSVVMTAVCTVDGSNLYLQVTRCNQMVANYLCYEVFYM